MWLLAENGLFTNVINHLSAGTSLFFYKSFFCQPFKAKIYCSKAYAVLLSIEFEPYIFGGRIAVELLKRVGYEHAVRSDSQWFCLRLRFNSFRN